MSTSNRTAKITPPKMNRSQVAAKAFSKKAVVTTGLLSWLQQRSLGRSCSYKVGNIIRILGKQALWPGIVGKLTGRRKRRTFRSRVLRRQRRLKSVAFRWMPHRCQLAARWRKSTSLKTRWQQRCGYRVRNPKLQVPLNATARLREAYKLAQREVDAKPSDVPEVDRPLDDNVSVRKAADAVKRVAEIHSRNQFPKPGWWLCTDYHASATMFQSAVVSRWATSLSLRSRPKTSES